MRAYLSVQLVILLIAGLIVSGVSRAAPPADLDARINAKMKELGVPGMAVSIVEDGKVVVAHGYGVRKLGSNDAVDADTIFPIGSVSKAFTSAALAVLVDQGKIGWDDKVIDHLPDFRMYDAWVTREMTIRDLLVHRSGLGLGAGDLMFVPRTSRSRADTVHALRYIKPATSFRSGYAYDNVLYVVAGQLIEAVTGQDWEHFVRENVFKPAGMSHSTSDTESRFANANRVHPHARLDGAIHGMGHQEMLDETQSLVATSVAPAGGVASSANDMARWIQVQLAHGAAPGADDAAPRIFSEAQSKEMWEPQVLMPISPYPGTLADATPQFSAYALGWDVQDYRGVKVLQHGGAVFGAQALIALVPGRNLGIALEINCEDSVVMVGLLNELLDHYLGEPKRDWIGDFATFKKNRMEAGVKALDESKSGKVNSKPSLPLAGYAGIYVDPWYGQIRIDRKKDGLHIDFTVSPGMAGKLEYYQYDTFRTRWDDRTLEPAYVTFALDGEGKVARITMKAVSPLADFSYDYQDLDFSPVSARDP